MNPASRRTGRGTVLAFDRPAGTMVVDVRYRTDGGDLPRSPYPPLAIPIPLAAPAWLFRVGVAFRYAYAADGYPHAGRYEDPAFMREFEPVDYWWCSTTELERMLGYDRGAGPARTAAEVARRRAEQLSLRAEVESRRPAEYIPREEDVAAARDRLRPYFPEWVGVAR
jgi:hypothetical protein